MKSQKIVSLNPAKTYEPIGEVAISSRAELYDKVRHARSAYPAWSSLAVKERTAILEPLYQAFVKHRHHIATMIAREIGMPISVCNVIDIDTGLRYMRGYLDNAATWLAPEVTFENEEEIHYLFFEPKGVAALSIPWNYPFTNFVWAAIQNLVVGNTIVFKHSEECPLTGKLLEDIASSARLPEGILHEVYGDGYDIGEALMNSDVDLLWFTGSTNVGKHLYQVAARKFIPAILELGGSAAGILFEDANLDLALPSIYTNRFIHSGQTCDALKRLIVHRSLFNTVVESLSTIITQKKIGDPLDPATDIGPLAAERQLIALERQVADAIRKGATVIIGGQRPPALQGAYYEPTILTNISFDMEVWKEEVFGPVLPIVSFDTEEEAIELANDSQYGLGGFIYTQNKDRALRVSRQLQTGNINVNSATYVIAQDPFGGYKYSGLGREHGKAGLRELCSSKVVAFTK